MHREHYYHLCTKHMHRYCRITRNGNYYEGYITDVDDCSVTLSMPIDDPPADPPFIGRGFGRGFRPGFRRGFRRGFFRPRRFPFFEVEEVVPFPFFTPFFPFVEESPFF